MRTRCVDDREVVAEHGLWRRLADDQEQDEIEGRDAYIAIATLMFLELGLSLLKRWLPALDRLLESLPLVIVENGRVLEDRLQHERVDVSDVLVAAREAHGLERLDQIKYAVLERSGGITIVPI